jgi:hypothetical protein
MASIGETGFWTNVIVRKSSDGKGYEQAYGHHRIEAARRSGIKEADFVVRDLDENMMLKMMELENQEDYRYCPLSLLESVKAVVNALAAGRIAPFEHTKTSGGEAGFARLAPSFAPKNGQVDKLSTWDETKTYTTADVAEYLGYTTKYTGFAEKNRKGENKTWTHTDYKVRAALDALYLLEVKAITTATIKDMNWSSLGKFVADIKAKREREILRTKKTAAEVEKIAAESRRLREEQKAKEKKAEEEHKALVKKLAEAKREEDRKKAKEIKERIEAKQEEAAKVAETYEVKKAVLETKVEEIKQKEVEAIKEDSYLPIRKETDRITHLLERRDEEDVVKALARKPLNSNDRERLRQAAIAKGTWYLDWVAQQFLPPLSAKNNLTEYKRREAAKRLAEEARKEKETE